MLSLSRKISTGREKILQLSAKHEIIWCDDELFRSHFITETLLLPIPSHTGEPPRIKLSPVAFLLVMFQMKQTKKPQ